jgi:hypothetical protein
MSSKLNNEQVAKLALYATKINAILLEALLAPPPETEDGEREVELEIFVVETDRKSESKK